MSVGDWVQSIVGVVSLLTSAAVAFWVYRRETRGRRLEAAKEAARARRREQHADDYREAVRALDALHDIFMSVLAAPKSDTELAKLGLNNEIKTMEKIGRRVDSLFLPLTGVWASAQQITSVVDLQQSLRSALDKSGKVDTAGLSLHFERAFVVYARQREAAHEGMQAVAKARAAIKEEWGRD
jgi:hypothetical protein